MAEDEAKMSGDQPQAGGDQPPIAPGRPKKRWRGWIAVGVAVVVVAAVIVVVAQGGSGGSSPLNAIAKAAEVTQREPGGQATIDAKISVSNSPQELTEEGTMSFDDQGRAKGEFTVKAAGEEVPITTIIDGTKSFTTSPLVEGKFEGKKWVELDLAKANPELASQSATESSPQEGIKALEGLIGAEEVGKEEIDGEPTTHYRGTIDTAKKVFGVKTHYKEPKIDVWIDGQNRVRRIEFDITGSAGKSSITSTIKMKMDYTEFGRVPKIEPPDPSEVFDETGMVEEAVQSQAGEG
jgi:hypothetical protein